MNPLSIIAGPLIDGINSLGKTFFGSKEERDKQSQEQFMSVQNSYQAEQSAPEKQNWFNSEWKQPGVGQICDFCTFKQNF